MKHHPAEIVAMTAAATSPATQTARLCGFRPLRWIALARERRALRDLDLQLLRDIGITGQQAQAEAEKHGWDIPGNRR